MGPSPEVATRGAALGAPWYHDGVFIRDLLRSLHEANVSYALVGGVAVNLHGVPRMTYDVDLVAAPTRENLAALAATLRGLGLQVRIPVKLEDFADRAYAEEMRTERNLIAVTFTDPTDPLREVDVLVAPPVEPAEIVERAMTLDFSGMPVSVAAIADLVAMKRASGRTQDKADIAQLEKIIRGGSHGR